MARMALPVLKQNTKKNVRGERFQYLAKNVPLSALEK